jgi:hypothetical protein
MIVSPVAEAEGDSKANLTDDIGYDDISDDELDDLITGAEDEREEKQSEKIGWLLACFICTHLFYRVYK